MPRDPHAVDGHVSDDAPFAPGSRPLDLTIGKPATPATWRRARAHAYCQCGGILDLTRSDTPESRRAGSNRTRIACVCETCSRLTYLTGKEMIEVARTFAQRHAAAILANIVARAERMDELLHELIDEEVLVRHVLPGSGEEVILPASPEEIAKVSAAALAHEQIVLRAAGVQAEKVEVDVTHHGPESALLEDIKREIVKEIREKAERTIDAEVVPAPASDGAGA